VSLDPRPSRALALTHGLHLIDPQRLARLERLFGRVDLADAEVEAEYQGLGRSPDYLLRELLTPSREAERRTPRRELLAAIFELLATERVWELGETLSLGLRQVIKRVPELAPLRPIARFACDLPFPAPLGRGWGWAGVFGLWRAATLAPCIEPLRAFATPEAVTAYRPRPVGGLAGLAGGDLKLRRALEAWQRSEDWAAWQALSEAIAETVGRGWLLGIRAG